MRPRSHFTLTNRSVLGQGRCYWQLERDICAQLACPMLPRLQNPGGGLTLEDVHTASMSKSFDYRVGS